MANAPKKQGSLLRHSLRLAFFLALAALFAAGGRYSAHLYPLARAPRAPAPPATADPCDAPPDFRALPLQEFLDVPVVSFSHPLLPAGAAPIRVYATKRPGASYGPHREFWETASEGSWEPTTFRILRGALTAGAARGRGTHWDIGSWVGPTSLFAAHYAARVVSMEPDPRAFVELLANARLNAALAPRLHAHRHCIAGASGPVDMTGPAPMGSSMSRVHGAARIPESAAREDNWGQRMVSWPAACSTPADFAARTGLRARELALVKVDVEGAEAALLPPLVEWLEGEVGGRGAKPPLFVELHVDFWSAGGDSARAVAAALGRYARAYVSQPERPGRKATDNVLKLFSPEALLESTGHICPGKEPQCMVLLIDEGEGEGWVQELLMQGEEA